MRYLVFASLFTLSCVTAPKPETEIDPLSLKKYICQLAYDIQEQQEMAQYIEYNYQFEADTDYLLWLIEDAKRERELVDKKIKEYEKYTFLKWEWVLCDYD